MGRIKQRYDALLAAEVVAAGAVMWFITRNSFFFLDDFLFLQQGEMEPMSLDYLRTSNYDHFAPITRAAYWIVQRAIPLNFRVAHLIPTLALTGSVACLALILRRLGRSPATYAAVSWFALSVYCGRVLDWWGASIHIFTALFFTMLCLHRHVRWEQDKRSGDRWLTLVFFVAALLVQERPLLIPLYIALLRYVILDPAALSPPRLWRRVREDLRFWAPFVLIEVAAVVHLRAFYSENAGAPPLGETIRFLRLSLTEGFLPGLIGQHHFQTNSDAGWHMGLNAAAVVGAVLLVTLVAFSVRYQQGRRAWAFGAVAYFVNMVILALGRKDVFDPFERAVDLQYYVEAQMFFCLAFGLAFSGDGARPQRRRPSGWRGQAGTAAILTVVAAVLALTMIGQRDLIRISHTPRDAHAYVSNAASGLARLADSGRPAEVLPLHGPEHITFPLIQPYDDHTTFLRLFRNRPDRNIDSPQKYVVSETGMVRLVRPFVQARPAGKSAVTAVGPTAVALQERDGEACFTPAPGGGLRVGLDRTVETNAAALFLGIDYRAARPAPLLLAQEEADGNIAYTFWPIDVPSGRHTAYVRLKTGSASAVTILGLTPGAHFCLRTAELVSLVFADRPSADGTCGEVGQVGQVVGHLPCNGRFLTPS